METKDVYKGSTYQRLKHMNKFYLYSGLSKQESDQMEIFHKALDVYENELMKVFNCNPVWPICLFDFTYKNKIPQFLVFKTHSFTIIEDYFAPGSVYMLEPQLELPRDEDYDVLMERGYHICNQDQNFVSNFKLLYNISEPILFNSKFFNFNITSDKDSSDVLNRFMRMITDYQNIEQAEQKYLIVLKEQMVKSNNNSLSMSRKLTVVGHNMLQNQLDSKKNQSEELVVEEQKQLQVANQSKEIV